MSSRVSPEPSHLVRSGGGGGVGYETLSTQIQSLTGMTSNLQRELAQLSRRSKDNATDLYTLKAATSTRDEDIRKSLRELSSNLAAKFPEGDAPSRLDHNTHVGSSDSIDQRDFWGSSPSAKKAYSSAPRMGTPSSFGVERDICASPTPVSDGSAGIALLEKVLREMATKEGQKKLVDLVAEMKSRSEDTADEGADDDSITKMLEEILDTVKDHSSGNALVRSGPNAAVHDENTDRSLQSISATPVSSGEVLPILNRVKNSVMEGGGLTNEVKALVRELRGEVLGMGRDIARKFEEAEAARSTQGESTPAPGKGEIADIVDESLHALQGQMDAIINENRQHSISWSEFQRNVNGAEIYGIVKQALNEFPFPQPESHGPVMERDDIVDTIREAWETNKPEIEFQNLGLEREEILECLTEGLKTYQPRRDDAVTYDEVVAAVQNGMKSFVPPPVQLPSPVSRDDIILTIRECLQSFDPQEVQLGVIREEVWRAVSEAIASKDHQDSSRGLQGPSDELTGGLRSALESGVSHDAIFHAVSDGLMANLAAVREAEGPRLTKEDVIHVVNDAFANYLPSSLSANPQHQTSGGGDFEAPADGFAAQRSTLSMNTTPSLQATREDLLDAIHEAFGSQNSEAAFNARDGPQPTLSRDELLSVVGEALENQGSREIELSRDDLMEAISSSLQEAITSDRFNPGGEVLERLQNLLDGIREEFRQYSTANGKDTEQVLDAVKDSLEVILKEIGSNNFTSPDSSGKDEIIDTVKEGLGLLQANMERVVTDAVMGNHGATNTPELLDAMEREFEHLRQSLGQLLIRNSTSGDKDEILDAIHDIAEGQRGSVVPAESKTDRDEIIAALRESFENFRTDALHHHRRDGGESFLSNTAQLLDAFNEGVDSIRDDLEKIRGGSSGAADTTATLDSIKDGLDSLRMDLRQSHAGEAGRVVTLADEPDGAASGQESLKSLIGNVQDKLERLESKSSSSVRKEHLDDILAELRDLQRGGVGYGGGSSSTSRGLSMDDASEASRKEDTGAIEALLRNTKAQLDDLVFPRGSEAGNPHLADIVWETKEQVMDLAGRSPTKSEIGTLETLLGDIFLALEGMKEGGGKAKGQGISSEEGHNPERLAKSDLHTIEAMIFEVKSQVENLKLPDADALAEKVDLQELSSLVTAFKEKMDTENEVTGQAFEARKVEHGGLADKIDEAKVAVGQLGDTLKSRLDGSSEGFSELKLLIETLAASSEKFSTVDGLKELTDLVGREFERSRGEHDMAKLETEERDASAAVKQEESRHAVVADLGSKIDKKLGEVLARYEEAQMTVASKFAETEDRDKANIDAVLSAKEIAEDIKFVIGTISNNLNETSERSNGDTKVFLDRIGESCARMEELQNDARAHQEQSRAGFDRAVAATDRVEAQLTEFHPELLESIQQILALIDKHYELSQKSAQDFRSEVASLPSIITPLLSLPAADRAKYDDGPVHEKLDGLLEYTAQNDQVQEMLRALLERSSDAQVHEKLDSMTERSGHATGALHEMLSTLLERSGSTGSEVASTRGQVTDRSSPDEQETDEKLDRLEDDKVHDKLDGLLDHADHAANTNSQIHGKLNEIMERSNDDRGKLDTFLERAANDNDITQMMKLDEMHKDIMETSRRMNEFLAMQSAMIAEDGERRRREAEEAGIALERRKAQREQVEGEIEGMNREKDDLIQATSALRRERDDLIKQTTKASKELSSIETALELRNEEMQLMQDRAETLEKRILEGVLDHARSVLVSRPGSVQEMNLKRVRSSQPSRKNSESSATSVATKDTRSILGNGVGIALKRRGAVPSNSAGCSTISSNAGNQRRIFSLSNVSGNRGRGDRSSVGGFGSKKRSHSVKANSALRNTSWSGASSFVDNHNKENESFAEEDEHDRSGAGQSDAETERRASSQSVKLVGGSAVASMVSGSTAGKESEQEYDDYDDDGLSRADEQSQGSASHQGHRPGDGGAERKDTVVYGPHSDSGLGSEMMS